MKILSSENLVLRQFAAAVRESGETVGEWLPWWKADFSGGDALAWFQTCENEIAARTAFDIGVFDKLSGVLLGSVAINRIDAPNRIATLEYIAENRLVHQGQPSAAAIYSLLPL